MGPVRRGIGRMERPAREEWSKRAGTGSTEGTVRSRELGSILADGYINAIE
jgi:hypothetical protein